MTSERKLPPTASIAHATDGAKLFAPSAARNLDPLCDLLTNVAPASGQALEIASGTGQHVVGFARRLPDLNWQPTEPDAARRASIDAHTEEAGLDNLAAAIALNATEADWGRRHSGQSLIILINLLHLISLPETRCLITEVANALTPGGRFVLYGPFMRGGELTSDGDASFHTSLTAQDPAIGYKDDFDILDIALTAGLAVYDVVEMPSNNLALIFEKPGN